MHTEALVQLTCGGPQTVYHGGLLHVRLRYFDAVARRPGLPQDVSALVTALDGKSVRVQLVNSSPLHERRVIVQAWAFGEHRFTEITPDGGDSLAVNGRHVEVILPPGRSIELACGMERYAHTPSYAQPF